MLGELGRISAPVRRAVRRAVRGRVHGERVPSAGYAGLRKRRPLIIPEQDQEFQPKPLQRVGWAVYRQPFPPPDSVCNMPSEESSKSN